jgi:hypothetical protein
LLANVFSIYPHEHTDPTHASEYDQGRDTKQPKTLGMWLTSASKVMMVLLVVANELIGKDKKHHHNG